MHSFNFMPINQKEMIQDIEPHQFDNTYKDVDIHQNDYVFHFKGNALLLIQDGDQFHIPRHKDLKLNAPEYTFVFSLNNSHYFLLWTAPEQLDEGLIYHEIRSSQTLFQKHIEWTATVAFQLKNWYEQNRFCGKCGSPTSESKNERAINCKSCLSSLYPNISPAIIVAIICDEKILLARGVHFREDFYSLVAGYVEIGESIEDAVVREVKEEVGIDVHNLRYYKSQPWPYSGSMMIGFIAEADEKQTIKLEEAEIAEAAWYSRDNLPDFPSDRSIAGEIITKFINNRL